RPPLFSREAVAVGTKRLEHHTGRLFDVLAFVINVQAGHLVHEFEPEFQPILTDHLDHPPRTRVLAIYRPYKGPLIRRRLIPFARGVPSLVGPYFASDDSPSAPQAMPHGR